MAIMRLKFDRPSQDRMKAAIWFVLYIQMIQLASLMDDTHQPYMLLHTWKPDQFSRLIHLCDLMATFGQEDGEVDKAGRHEKCTCEL